MWKSIIAVAVALFCATPAVAQTPMWVCVQTAAGCVPAGTYSVSGTVVAAGTGTTGAVTASLPGAASKTTFICGFDVSAAGTGSIGPITITPLTGAAVTFTYALSAATPQILTMPFLPCIPASAQNTAITVTTTADGSATAVDVNVWGYQQ